MKKLLIIFIFIFLSSQFVFSDDVNVSSFIGVYTGYKYRLVNNNEEFNSLLFGISTRYGLSYEISDDLKLYFLGLLDLGSCYNFTPSPSIGLIDDIILGGEIKAKYKNYFFGLSSGGSFYIHPNVYVFTFLRPTFGYSIKPNLLLDFFVEFTNIGIEQKIENKSFRSGLSFFIFK